MSTDTAHIKTLDFPLDILRRIAEVVGQGMASFSLHLPAARRDVKNCCLVSRLFAEAFQPYIFYLTLMSNSTGLGHPRKQLDILTSSPHIGVHIKKLTLKVYDGGDETVLYSILGGGFLTGLRSLTVIGSHWSNRRISWTSLSQAFRSSIERFCSDSQTLQTLNLIRLDGVPASVFAQPTPTLTNICLGGSHPVFDFPEAHSAPSRLVPLSLNVCGVYFSELHHEDVVERGNGFFSRVRSLRGTTSWRLEQSAAFDKFLSLVASLSHLESLDVSIYVHPSPTFNGPYPANWIKSLPQVKGLKHLTLSTSSAPESHFISSLPNAIGSLDTSRLERFSIGIHGLRRADLPSICVPRTEIPEGPLFGGWSELDTMLAEKSEQGKLERLEEVWITIRLGVEENDTELEESRNLVQGASFLPSFPVGKVIVVLKMSVGDIIYDSRGHL